MEVLCCDVVMTRPAGNRHEAKVHPSHPITVPGTFKKPTIDKAYPQISKKNPIRKNNPPRHCSEKRIHFREIQQPPPLITNPRRKPGIRRRDPPRHCSEGLIPSLVILSLRRMGSGLQKPFCIDAAIHRYSTAKPFMTYSSSHLKYVLVRIMPRTKNPKILVCGVDDATEINSTLFQMFFLSPAAATVFLSRSRYRR